MAETHTPEVSGQLVRVREQARKADRFAYGWNRYNFFVDYRTGEIFAVPD
jgi:hypothetical protein